MKRSFFHGSVKGWLRGLVLAAVMVFGGASAARADDAKHYAEVKQELAQDRGIQRGFPRLGGNFEVIGEATQRYNCIAHSLGTHERWVNPETGPSHAPLSGMDRLYADKGYYREHELNWRAESGLEKVVLYATLNPDGTIDQVTHAAHQERDGTFTSKLGQLPVIRHETPEALRGPTYGLPVAVYVRPINGNLRAAR
jgi:type VI secretion system secreted protein VgrG